MSRVCVTAIDYGELMYLAERERERERERENEKTVHPDRPRIFVQLM